VSPQDGPIEVERRDHRERLFGGGLVKAGRQRVDRFRAAIAGAVGNHDPMAGRERGDLMVERIRVVAPATVQDDDRRSVPGVAVVDPHRRAAWSKRRRIEEHVSHARTLC
jgi:hypothetical protein